MSYLHVAVNFGTHLYLRQWHALKTHSHLAIERM